MTTSLDDSLSIEGLTQLNQHLAHLQASMGILSQIRSELTLYWSPRLRETPQYVALVEEHNKSTLQVVAQLTVLHSSIAQVLCRGQEDTDKQHSATGSLPSTGHDQGT